MAKVYPCKTCGGSFELSEFPRRQQDHVQASRPGWCKSCSPAARSPNAERASKERQVASFMHTESGGNVDGKKRTLRGCPRRAARPSKAAKAERKDLYAQLLDAYDVKVLDYFAAYEKEEELRKAEVERDLQGVRTVA